MALRNAHSAVDGLTRITVHARTVGGPREVELPLLGRRHARLRDGKAHEPAAFPLQGAQRALEAQPGYCKDVLSRGW